MEGLYGSSIGLGFRIVGLRFRIRVKDLGFKVGGLGLMV